MPAEIFLPCLQPFTDDESASSFLPNSTTTTTTQPDLISPLISKRIEEKNGTESPPLWLNASGVLGGPQSAHLHMNLLEALIAFDDDYNSNGPEELLRPPSKNASSNFFTVDAEMPLDRRKREILVVEKKVEKSETPAKQQLETVFSVRAHENDCMKLKVGLDSWNF